MDSLALAGYAVQQLQATGVDAWRNADALTVIFPQPSGKLCHKWQLASENGISHLICMPGITKEQIDAFVLDYMEDKDHPLSGRLETIGYHLN